MIIYVSSFEEAKAYPVMYNTSEIFFDNNKDTFYCKAVDKMGKATMSTYDYHQVENEKPLTSADFVPREQFDALNSKIDDLMALLAQSASMQHSPQLETGTNTKRGPKEVNNDGK